MTETYPQRLDSNCRTVLCKLPGREVDILKECYESVGEPEPDEGKTLKHNTEWSDFLRAILRGEVTEDDVTASEPADDAGENEDVFLPLEISLTQAEVDYLDGAGVPTTSPRSAYRRNSETAQQMRGLLQNFCNAVVE